MLLVTVPAAIAAILNSVSVINAEASRLNHLHQQVRWTTYTYIYLAY